MINRRVVIHRLRMIDITMKESDDQNVIYQRCTSQSRASAVDYD